MSVSREASTPTEIRKQGGEAFRLTWSDGHRSRFPARFLRGRCPCAHCVDEVTGARRYGETDVPGEMTIRGGELVGTYAIQITFGDGHGTGIYSFAYLREICPCEACREEAGAEG